jgi:DNA repair photolyase
MFVRWDDLTVDGEQQAQLPGYRDAATVRRFDAPEALDTRFYEVHAKSALNRVPEQSRMPFRWTVNPYRGCLHACTYCLAPDTPVLLANGRTTAICDLEVGEEVVGTERRGRYRRYVTTKVLDRWASIKPGYAVALADGNEIVASGDHRFLSSRGWKHVTGAECGPMQRPHLTTNNRLLGPGGFVASVDENDDYRRGYLCGIIRGDGHIGRYEYPPRPGRSHDRVFRFRLALVDDEALMRSSAYLAHFDVITQRFEFKAAAAGYREAWAIRTSRESNIASIESLIRWPARRTPSWVRGFLAGIFDAEGSHSAHTIRIPNKSADILAQITSCMDQLGFDSVLEGPNSVSGSRCVRLGGGISERMRFLTTTNPAITRKRTIVGEAVKGAAPLQVTSVRSLRTTMRMYDITTGTGDFIAAGVISHNCFARPTHTYLGFDAGRDFEREIVVKVNVPEVLRSELARPSWKREHVALGTNTDPYQWVEARYRLMEGIWEALRDAANPCSVLTKSPLLLRDLGLMLEIAERTSFTACLSVPTLDEKAWRATEPRSPNPRARLEAVAELNRAGIPTGILIAPLMPGINDAPEQVEPLLEAAREAGATSIGGVALHLRGEVRGVFMSWLEAERPELVPRYRELYRRGASAPPEERRRLARMVRKGDAPSAFRTHGHAPDRLDTAAPGRRAREPLQATLF